MTSSTVGNVSYQYAPTPQGSIVIAGVPFSIPASTVRTFTVTADTIPSGQSVIVDFGSGNSISMTSSGSRTWGSADGAERIQTSNVTITSGAGVVCDVIWETS